MIIDGNQAEIQAMEAFLHGNTEEAERIQDGFISELYESMKTQDHCSCKKVDCKHHGKCIECVAIHRGHKHHLPNCFHDMVNERLSVVSALTEHTLYPPKLL